MGFYPDVDTLISAGSHVDSTEPLLEVRRSLRSIISNLLYFCMAVVGVYVINLFVSDKDLANIPVLNHFSLRLLSIVPVALLIEIVRKYNDDLYVFRMHHLTHHNGRLSLTYQVPDIRYTDLRAIAVYQDIMGRFFDYGDVELSTAAQGKLEILLEGVRSPHELGDLIDRLRANSNKVLQEESIEIVREREAVIEEAGEAPVEDIGEPERPEA